MIVTSSPDGLGIPYFLWRFTMMSRKRILAAVFGAAALITTVPSAAAATAPAKPKPHKPAVTTWTLCAHKTKGTVRLATKRRPCTWREERIVVAPAQPKPQPKPADVRPAPYYLRDGSVTKHCAATGKWRGTWVVECKQVGVKPVPTPVPSQTATPEPSQTASPASQSTRTTPANPRGPRDAS